MSNQSTGSRTELVTALIRQNRLSQIASDKMDDAFARKAGVNLSDARCLDLLDVHGGMTAGDLAQAASLSPGAVTSLLDRLERLKLVTRRRDETDRRRVVVELTDRARKLAWDAYGPLATYAESYIDALSDQELAVIVRFLEVGTEVNERRADELREDGS